MRTGRGNIEARVLARVSPDNARIPPLNRLLNTPLHFRYVVTLSVYPFPVLSALFKRGRSPSWPERTGLSFDILETFVSQVVWHFYTNNLDSS